MKKRKWIKGLLLGAILSLGAAICVACDGGNNGAKYTGFLAGAAYETKIAEMVLLEEIVDYPTDGESEIVITKGEYEEDVTGDATWTPLEPGEYTITHTVTSGSHKGAYTHKITVITNIMMWTHYTGDLNYLYDTDLQFDRFFANLNLSVDTYYNWTPFVKSVRVNDKVTEIAAGATSYHISSMEPHYFVYGVRTETGEELKDVVRANIKYSDTITDLYLSVLSEGTHTIEAAGVQSVKINDEPCADVTITDTEVVFDKEMLYEKYRGINFVSMQTPNGEVRDTINVYTEMLSFENYITAPDMITLHSGNMTKETGEKRISDKYATDGKSSLETVSKDYQWPQFVIDMDYLHMIFENPDVTALAFDMTYEGSNAAYTSASFTAIGGHEMIFLNTGEPQRILVTRENYEATKTSADERDAYGWRITMQNARNRVGGSEKAVKVYFDNFRAITQLKDDALLYDESATGTYAIELSGVKSVTLNGEAIPNDKLTILGEQVIIDKAWLMTQLGDNQFEFSTDTKCYSKNISIYYKSYDFEDIAVENVGFISWYNGYSNAKTELVDYNGSKALRLYTAGGQWPVIQVSAKWLGLLFADKTVGSVVFDVSLDNCGKEEVTYRYFTSNAVNYTKVPANEVTTVAVTRAKYQALQAEIDAGTAKFDFFRMVIQNQTEHPGGTSAHAFIFDNFRTMPENFVTGEDFEDKAVGDGDFIKWLSPSVTCNRQIIEYNNSNALRLHIGATSYPQTWISAEWLANAFADETVTAVSFEMTIVPNNGSEIEYREVAFMTGDVVERTKFKANETQTFTLTREKYEAWLEKAYNADGLRIQVQNRAQNGAVIGGGTCEGMGLVFDNVKIVKAVAAS